MVRQYYRRTLFRRIASATIAIFYVGLFAHADEVESLRQEFRALCDQGKFGDAEKKALQMVKNARMLKTPQPAELAGCYEDLALVKSELGEYKEAEYQYNLALEIYQTELKLDGTNAKVATTLRNKARVQQNHGQPKAALKLLEDECSVLRSSANQDQTRELAKCLNVLASLYEDQGSYDRAESCFVEARDIKEKTSGTDSAGYAETIDSLALLYDAEGRLSQAEQLHNEAFKLRSKSGAARTAYAISLNNLGWNDLLQGHYAAAKTHLEQAQQTWKSIFGGDLHPFMASCLDNLGLLQAAQGALGEAEKLHQSALDIKSELLYSGHAEVARTKNNLARDLYLQGRYEMALARVKDAIGILQSSGVHKELLQECFIVRAHILWKLKYQQDAVRDLRQSIELSEVLGGYNFATNEPKFFARWTNPLETMVAWQAELWKSHPERVDMSETLAIMDRHCHWSVVPVDQPHQAFKPASLDQLRSWIKQQPTLLLEYFVGNNGGYLFMLPPGGQPQLLELQIGELEAKDLGADAGPLTVKQLRTILTIDGQPLKERLLKPEIDSTNRLAALWRLLVPQSQREALSASKDERLVLISDGALADVPFEALIIGPTKQRLGDRGPLIVGSSATDLFDLSQGKEAHNSDDAQFVPTEPSVPAPSKHDE